MYLAMYPQNTKLSERYKRERERERRETGTGSRRQVVVSSQRLGGEKFRGSEMHSPPQSAINIVTRVDHPLALSKLSDVT